MKAIVVSAHSSELTALESALGVARGVFGFRGASDAVSPVDCQFSSFLVAQGGPERDHEQLCGQFCDYLSRVYRDADGASRLQWAEVIYDEPGGNDRLTRSHLSAVVQGEDPEAKH